MTSATVGTWRTPGGHPAEFAYRPEPSSDWNTVSAIVTHDEYQIPTGLSGLLLDVGAHIGGWTVAAALDNPDAQVVAIEALPENVELLRDNVERNGLADRVVVLHGSATNHDGADTMYYGLDETHRYIGDQRHTQGPSVEVDALPLPLGLPIRLMKIDCEGCEFRFLDTDLSGVEEIVGEYHGPGDSLRLKLERTHRTEFTGDPNFGAFRAWRS